MARLSGACYVIRHDKRVKLGHSTIRWIAILFLAIVLGSSLIPVSAAPPSAPHVPEWAAKFLSAWYYSFNQGDASGVAVLFSEKARLQETVGRAEIQKTLAAEFEKKQRRCQGDFDGFKVLGGSCCGLGVMKHALTRRVVMERPPQRRNGGYLCSK